MRILSFDQSSNLSGYCLYDGEILASGTIDKHKIKDGAVRIEEMGLAICKKIEELKPLLVTIEDIQNQSSVKTVIMLARLQGIILGYCYAHSIEAKILTPSQWRSKLKFKLGAGVKRDELKEQAMNYIAERFSLDVDVDQSEAICIAVVADMIFNDDWEI